MEMFNLYLIIGGMPAAVEKYRTTGSIDDVMDEHRAIIEQYKLDFTQYEAETANCSSRTFMNSSRPS